MIFRRLLIAAMAAMLGLLYWQNRPAEQPPARPLTAPVHRASATPLHEADFIGDEVSGRMCHVSSIAPLGDVRMAAVWYAGSREGASDVAIFFSEFNGTNWSTPRVLVDCSSCRSD